MEYIEGVLTPGPICYQTALPAFYKLRCFSMFDAIFPWLLLIGILSGAFCLLILIGDFLTSRSTRIDLHVHPVRTVRELKHIIERNGETYVFEETEDCMAGEQGI